ncbi:MAG: hypothetical protein U9O18_04005, partial [Chloroflexota bacterium]|nr:hypothetical protein [Chloroflexota bacterium]
MAGSSIVTLRDSLFGIAARRDLLSIGGHGRGTSMSFEDVLRDAGKLLVGQSAEDGPRGVEGLIERASLTALAHETMLE